MKVCPRCQRRYADDSRELCEDGTPLKKLDLNTPLFSVDGTTAVDEEPTIDADDDAATRVSSTHRAMFTTEEATTVDPRDVAQALSMKPLPIISPARDHELDDRDTTAPTEEPTTDVVVKGVIPADAIIDGAEDDSPDPLPPIRGVEEVIENAKRRVVSQQLQLRQEQVEKGALLPKPVVPDDCPVAIEPKRGLKGAPTRKALLTPSAVEVISRPPEDSVVTELDEPPDEPIDAPMGHEQLTEAALPLPPPQRSARNWPRIALLVSGLLFALVIGFVLGRLTA